MNHCATCKHWSQNDHPPAGYGNCEAMPYCPGSGVLAFITDSEQYFTWLYTRAEFGCVLHDPVAAAVPYVPAVGDCIRFNLPGLDGPEPEVGVILWKREDGNWTVRTDSGELHAAEDRQITGKV